MKAKNIEFHREQFRITLDSLIEQHRKKLKFLKEVKSDPEKFEENFKWYLDQLQVNKLL